MIFLWPKFLFTQVNSQILELKNTYNIILKGKNYILKISDNNSSFIM